MAKNDIVMKQYLTDKERFADLMNGSFFQGRQIIKPENLVEKNGESDLYLTDKNKKKRAIARYRDVVMETDFAIFAEENQAEVHYAMPVRGMLYDSLGYTDQISMISKEHKKKGDKLVGGEFLSGIKKDDKLTPIVSLVMYYGEDEWDASEDIHGMLNFGKSNEIKEVLKSLVPNYKINLIDVSNISNTKLYKTDLQVLFEMIKYKHDQKGLENYIIDNKDLLERIDEDALDMLGVLLHEEDRFDKYNKKEGGKRNMCKAIDDWIEEIETKVWAQATVKVKDLELKVDEAEDRIREAESKVQAAESKVQEAENKLREAESKEYEARTNLLECAKKLKDILELEIIAEKMNLPLEVVEML